MSSHFFAQTHTLQLGQFHVQLREDHRSEREQELGVLEESALCHSADQSGRELQIRDGRCGEAESGGGE